MRRRSSLVATAALGAAVLSLQLFLAPQPQAAEDPYAAEPAPLTVADCGRCHPVHFKNLKEAGGRHRFDCRDCHQVFHAYNPRRNNFAELMPQCGTCHGTPHGTVQTDCLVCHENPHAPKRAPALAKVKAVCADCHAKPAAQLRQFPSAHSKQACDACHSERHGRVPVCSECHRPHFQGQDGKACLECHPVHQPKQISLPLDADARTCKVCHGKVYGVWTETKSKHGKVNCSVCHVKHGVKPSCTECHKPPHDPKMLAKFKGCLSCHLDAHNLPVK